MNFKAYVKALEFNFVNQPRISIDFQLFFPIIRTMSGVPPEHCSNIEIFGQADRICLPNAGCIRFPVICFFYGLVLCNMTGY